MKELRHPKVARIFLCMVVAMTIGDLPVGAEETLVNRNRPSDDTFIPLLAPVVRKKVALSMAENIFHGRLSLRNIYQRVNNGTYDMVSRAQSDGSIERLYGSTLSLVWNGQVSYREGTAFTSATDFEQPRVRMASLALNEKLEDGSLARLGRFLAPELPGLGFVDGLQLERHATDNLKLGVAGGTRPEPRELGIQLREPIMSGYGNYEAGKPGEAYYSGTLGFFQTLFSGTVDEMAVLYDQRADIGPKLNLYISSQLDLDAGAARVHRESSRLTRLDVYATSPVTEIVTFRAGTNHFELPDTAAQRDLAGAGNLAPFDSGYWRYWAGSMQRLPENFQLDEQFDLIKTADRASYGQARGTISHQGLFMFPLAFLSFTAYSLNRVDGTGAGGILSGTFPMLDNRMNLTANSGFRYSGLDGAKKKLQANDASLYMNWRLTRAWEVNLGVVQTYQDTIQSTLIDTGLSYRW